jgi:hypothetical protein
VVPRELDGALDPGVDGVIGRLEPEDEEVFARGDAGGRRGLSRVEQAAVRGREPRLGDRSGGVDRLSVVGRSG